jgi:hypothetical protein
MLEQYIGDMAAMKIAGITGKTYFNQSTGVLTLPDGYQTLQRNIDFAKIKEQDRRILTLFKGDETKQMTQGKAKKLFRQGKLNGWEILRIEVIRSVQPRVD